MSGQDALLALPGPSTTSLVLNIPHVRQVWNDPVVLMDSYDYEKIHARAVYENSTKYQFLTLAYDELIRQGVVHLIDYSDFYPTRLRGQNTQRVDRLVEDLPEDIGRRYATAAVGLWAEYARSPDQEPFRGALGEDVQDFSKMRQSEYIQQQKMENGTGDSRAWLRKVFNKDLAALHIRRNVDRHLEGYNVIGVVAGGEHLLVGQLHDSAGLQQLADHNVPPAPISTEKLALQRLEASERMYGLMPEPLSETRKAMTKTSKLAREVADVDGKDWFVLGPHLLIPLFDDLFDMERIAAEFRARELPDIQNEAVEVLSELQEEKQSATAGKLEYLGEYVAEYRTEKPAERENANGFSPVSLTQSLDHVLRASVSSKQIPSLVEEGGYDQAAVLVALSFLRDPPRRYETEDIYRRAVDLKHRIDPPAMSQAELAAYEQERQGETWGDIKNWFEDPDSDR